MATLADLVKKGGLRRLAQNPGSTLGELTDEEMDFLDAERELGLSDEPDDELDTDDEPSGDSSHDNPS
ncbi:hypothetical protein KJ903_02425 [Patescibacteria group bacterium]|nr:hypothetical protein [Patescibacteria group bacterium]